MSDDDALDALLALLDTDPPPPPRRQYVRPSAARAVAVGTVTVTVDMAGARLLAEAAWDAAEPSRGPWEDADPGDSWHTIQAALRTLHLLAMRGGG